MLIGHISFRCNLCPHYYWVHLLHYSAPLKGFICVLHCSPDINVFGLLIESPRPDKQWRCVHAVSHSEEVGDGKSFSSGLLTHCGQRNWEQTPTRDAGWKMIFVYSVFWTNDFRTSECLKMTLDLPRLRREVMCSNSFTLKENKNCVWLQWLLFRCQIRTQPSSGCRDAWWKTESLMPYKMWVARLVLKSLASFPWHTWLNCPRLVVYLSPQRNSATQHSSH